MTGPGPAGGSTPSDMQSVPEPDGSGEAGAEEPGSGYRWIKFYITEAAYDALVDAAAGYGDTRTDTINRAIQVYAGIREASAAGGGSCIVTTDGHVRPVSRRFLRQLLSRARGGRS